MPHYEYINKLTGEHHTLDSLLKEWREKYGMAQPTNEYYAHLLHPYYDPPESEPAPPERIFARSI